MDHPNRRRFLSGASAALMYAAASPTSLSLSGTGSATRLSVSDFGALGDFDPVRDVGTDDTGAINAAIASLHAGQIRYFPAGNYLVSVMRGEAEKALLSIPVGAAVFMEDHAWMFPSTKSAIVTVFTPPGSNMLKVNVNGRSIRADADVADESAWVN